MAKIIADIGSCMGARLDRCLDAIRLCKDLGVSVVKFQMFYGEKYTKVGNIELPRDLWPQMVEFAQEIEMPITASAFDFGAVDLLNRSPVPFIKFSYGNRFKDAWFEQSEKQVMVSCDPLSYRSVPKEALKLYCIPEYPVRYQVDFDTLFPKFDGFSDHTMGIRQSVVAHNCGATWIEKHLKLDPEIGCPDEAFAIDARQMDQLVRSVS